MTPSPAPPPDDYPPGTTIGIDLEAMETVICVLGQPPRREPMTLSNVTVCRTVEKDAPPPAFGYKDLGNGMFLLIPNPERKP